MSGTIQSFAGNYMPNLDGHNIMYIIVVGLVTVNFFIEFAINLVCAPALFTVSSVVERQILKKYLPKKVEENKKEEV